jgi:hypothetical protein
MLNVIAIPPEVANLQLVTRHMNPLMTFDIPCGLVVLALGVRHPICAVRE